MYHVVAETKHSFWSASRNDRGKVNRHYAHAGLGTRDGQECIWAHVCCVIWDESRFESKSSEGAFTKPYAHAGLAAGDAETNFRSNEKDEKPLIFIAFREHAAETQKSLRV